VRNYIIDELLHPQYSSGSHCVTAFFCGVCLNLVQILRAHYIEVMMHIVRMKSLTGEKLEYIQSDRITGHQFVSPLSACR